MPIYEYACDACGHALEALQKISEPPLTDCPACGKPSLKKKISAAGFQLTGTGWYVTDFRDKGKSKDKKEGAKTEGAVSTEKTASETKPASSGTDAA